MWVYIWTNTYEYSYDFRGKTTSQVTAEWFTIKEWNFTINSNGVTSSSSSGRVLLHKTVSNVATAKKIILNNTFVLGSSATGCSFRLTNNNRTYTSWIQLTVSTNNYEFHIWWDKVATLSWMSAGTYTWTTVLDLENKIATFSVSWKATQTYTITDTQVNNIRNYDTLVELQCWNSSCTISNISVTIED